jgi:hypothetical protein
MMSTRIEPGEKLDDETVAAANARLAAKGIQVYAPVIDPELLRPDPPSAADLDAVAAEQKAAIDTARKPRSDKGTKRGPIVSKEPEAAAVPSRITIGESAANRLCILLEDVLQAERNYWDAEKRRSRAMIAYNAFVDELRG